MLQVPGSERVEIILENGELGHVFDGIVTDRGEHVLHEYAAGIASRIKVRLRQAASVTAAGDSPRRTHPLMTSSA